MGKSPQKDRETAADLIRGGYPHGRRFTKGIDNVPKSSDVGSAAYRRMMAKKRK
jgi:hypothetical protein